MILSCAEMKALEERAFADGVSAEELMEEAGAHIAAAVNQFSLWPGRCVVHFGKGHNGGDALVAARYLAQAGWEIEFVPAFPEEQWAPLTRQKWEEAQVADELHATYYVASSPTGRRPLVVLDGLLGIGAGGALREPIRTAAVAINRLRSETDAVVFALDLPTGLDGDTGHADCDAVVADVTLTIGCAKTGLLADGAERLVGRLAVLPLRELTARLQGSADASVATPETLKGLLPRRQFDLHKGDCGRVGIVAGSPGTSGAAILCADAALHAGAGLITLYVPPEIHASVTARITPEIMVREVTALQSLLHMRHDVLAIGPGLGRDRDAEVLELIARAPLPMVVDADALNALATRMDVLDGCAGPRLLTPHPGEMQRLDAGTKGRSRKETVQRFIERFQQATLLLKGARTLVGQANHPLSYNSTGSPGMATGGMGDVLTGICAALAGQGLSLYDAARFGTWLGSRSAELALQGSESEESLSPTHVIVHLGGAFREYRAGRY